MDKTKSGKRLFKNPWSKWLAMAAIALVLGAGVYALVNRDNQPAAPEGVNLAPATEQEKSEAQQNKDNIVDQQNNQNSSNQPSTGNKKQVTVFITNATYSSINSYAAGVIEDNGTCSATFTQGSTVITRTSQGFSNVSYTQCAPIMPNLPNQNGWSVVVKYSSAAAEGSSQTQTF